MLVFHKLAFNTLSLFILFVRYDTGPFEIFRSRYLICERISSLDRFLIFIIILLSFKVYMISATG